MHRKNSNFVTSDCAFVQKEKATEPAKKRQAVKPKASPKAKAAPRVNRKKAGGDGALEEEENALPNDARRYFKQGQKFITPPNVRCTHRTYALGILFSSLCC